MRAARPASFALIAPVLLAACGGGGNTGAGAVSEGEARALDEAAEMLEERRLPDGALPPPGQTEESADQTDEEEASE